MLDAAQDGGYAYPAINITSIITANAALKAFADAKSDGIIQVSTGGGQFASGLNVNDATPIKWTVSSAPFLMPHVSAKQLVKALFSTHTCSTAPLLNSTKT